MTIHTRQPVEIHKRKKIPLAVRYEVLKRQCAPEHVEEVERKGGKLKDKCAKLLMHAKCALSGEDLKRTGVEWDHEIPLALGGTNEPDNIQAVAPKPHREKTDKDDADISRADRRRLYQETGRSSAKKNVKRIENRGFPSKEERAAAKAWKQSQKEKRT